jgi:signal recognition particle subunit SRP54
LEVLGKQIDVPVHAEGTATPASTIAKNALKLAREKAYTIVLIDTAGRLQIDDTLMQELDASRRHSARGGRHDRPGSRQCRRRV